MRSQELYGTEAPYHLRLELDHDEHGQRIAKYVNGQLTERYRWHDLVRMDAAVMNGVLVDFLYVWDDAAYGGVSGRAETQSRASRGTGAIDVQKKPRRGLRPSIMLYGDDFYHLYYDQVGSLRVVADEDGIVIKEVLYDSFGRILEDTNPAMLVPLGFGFGLHDRDTGWVRMGWRDYDPETGRFTALDPIGYEGGDSDLYGYCLDDPVNLVDPLGLESFWNGPGGRISKEAITAGLSCTGPAAAWGSSLGPGGTAAGAATGFMLCGTGGLLRSTIKESIFGADSDLQDQVEHRQQTPKPTWK